MASLTPPPYLTAIRAGLTRRALAALLAVAGVLVFAAGARAATVLDIRGGGDGHGIGMSQYGAEGYALHGATYQTILAHYFQGTALGSVSPTRTVRVLLGDGRASFAGATAAGGRRLALATTYTVTPAARGRLQLRTSAGRSAGTFAAPLTVTGRGVLQVSGHGRYRGALQLTPDGHGGVQTVDAVGLDDYVRGVVAEEMPASWAPAALEAQAVAARTYAVTAGVAGHGYDLYDDDRSQAYGGAGAETAATNAAVATTGGRVVTYAGHPAATYFFTSSGGYTESIQDAWPGATAEPWLTGVPDPYDGAAGDPYHSWTRQLTVASATARLRGLVKGTLVGIVPVPHGRSPRVVTARIIGTRGQTTVTGAQLQTAFGLDSTLAAFATITTNDPRGRLTGAIYPAAGAGTVAVQSPARGEWRTVARARVSPAGTYAVSVAAGRYRIADGSFAGPVVTVR